MRIASDGDGRLLWRSMAACARQDDRNEKRDKAPNRRPLGHACIMPPHVQSFRAFVVRKTTAAATASIDRLNTIVDRSSAHAVEPIGNGWSRVHFDGEFFLAPLPVEAPAVSLVFVQSRD